MNRRVSCSACGTDLSPSAEPGSKCPECGVTARTVHLELAAEANVASAMTWTARSPNAALGRRHALEAALADAEAAIDGNRAGAAQSSVKQALQMIHEHDDARRRGEWTRSTWSPDELGMWTAHIGARNAAHHNTSTTAGVVALHSGDKRVDRLTWDVDPASIANRGRPRSPARCKQANTARGWLGRPSSRGCVRPRAAQALRLRAKRGRDQLRLARARRVVGVLDRCHAFGTCDAGGLALVVLVC
jgi:hypothetical protein